jgi:hypothetical protein
MLTLLTIIGHLMKCNQEILHFQKKNGGPTGNIEKGSFSDGYQGNGLSLNYGDYAFVNMTDFPTEDYTVSFWANVNPNQRQGLFSVSGLSSGHDRHIGITSTGEGYLRIWNGAYRSFTFSHGLINDGLWHQWTLSTKTGQGTSLYVDDNLVFFTGLTDHSDFSSEAGFYLGYSYDLGHAVGGIDEVSVISGSLTPAQIRQATINNVPATAASALSLATLSLGFRRRTRKK